MSTQISEKPIIMSTDMVKAILDGRKTQTRRTKGLDKYNENSGKWHIGIVQAGNHSWWSASSDSSYAYRIDCPYGQVGDRLWVRETFAKRPLPSGNEQILFKAEYNELVEMLDLPDVPILWKPSIHLPKDLTRIWLEITDIRVERLQDITEGEVLLEGANTKDGLFFQGDKIMMFHKLWNSLNEKRGYGWDTNPWVWVISFKKDG